MFFFFEEADSIPEEQAQEPVRIDGAYNLKSRPISKYEVTMPYGDLILIIGMLRDYIRIGDEAWKDDINWEVYYRKRFRKMADRLSDQLGYDYDKAVEKCRKKQEKESKSDIGEDAMALAVKYGARKGKAEDKNGDSDTGRDQEKGKGNRDPDRLQDEGT